MKVRSTLPFNHKNEGTKNVSTESECFSISGGQLADA